MKDRIFVSLPLLALLLTSCQSSSLKVPTFAKSQGVRFTAYSGPTVEGWVHNGKVPNTMTDENMKKLADAGFNKILALYEGGTNASDPDTYEMIKKRSKKAEEDAMVAIPLAEKYGIKYCVRDWSFYGLVKNYTSGYSPNILTDEQYKQVIDEMFNENNPYIHSPGFGGNFAHDEPFYDELERIAVQVRLYNEALARQGATGEAIVNLFNCTVGLNVLTDHGNPVTYEDYVDQYMRLIAPQVGYICYDYYPLVENFYDGSYVRNSYLYNLNLMAKKCKEMTANGTPVELRTFLQSIGNWTGMRDMVSIGDFRFQIYCELAFGSRELTYYEYANVFSEEEGGFALFNTKTNEYNWTFDCAAKVNNEVHAFEDAYLSYNWDGFMYKNADEMYDNQAFDMISDDAIEKHPRLKIKDCSEDVLVGTFKNSDNDDAFMVVNYTDPYHQKNNEVTLHFNNARGLLMYRYGQKVVVTLPRSGNYTMKLYPGEGRFIIPIK